MRNSKNIFKFAADIISRYLRSNGYFLGLKIGFGYFNRRMSHSVTNQT